MKKFLGVLIGGVLFLTIMASHTSAHVLETDGDIGAVIHIDPNDDPIIGEPATFFFEFKDKSGNLNLADCTCKVRILQQNEELFVSNLISDAASLESPSFSFIFPEPAIYTVQVSGSSATNSFQAFTLSYDLRVDNTNSQKPVDSNPSSNPLPMILIACVIAVITGIIIKDKLFTKKSRPLSLVLVFFLGVCLILYSTKSTYITHHTHGEVHLENHVHECCTQPISPATISLAIQAPRSFIQVVPVIPDSFNHQSKRMIHGNRSPPREDLNS